MINIVSSNNDMVGVFSGRTITSGDMDLIKWARKTYPNLSRHELAGTVCELLGWVTWTLGTYEAHEEMKLAIVTVDNHRKKGIGKAPPTLLLSHSV
jgi:hypothetical protein